MVEHTAVNRGVVSSSLTWGAKNVLHLHKRSFFVRLFSLKKVEYKGEITSIYIHLGFFG